MKLPVCSGRIACGQAAIKNDILKRRNKVIQLTAETNKEKMDKAMELMLEASEKLNSGDNLVMICPICKGELIVYKPFKKKIAAKCKTENCIRVVC
jgi:hypothetical protein